MEERRRKMAEAEEREREKEKKEDEERDEKIRELEGRIAEKARRRAEKKARREGGGKERDADEDVEMGGGKESVSTFAPAVDQQTATAKAPVDIPMSDDPVKFWETQWPKTKARLLAAQRTKERRAQEMSSAA